MPHTPPKKPRSAALQPTFEVELEHACDCGFGSMGCSWCGQLSGRIVVERADGQPMTEADCAKIRRCLNEET